MTRRDVAVWFCRLWALSILVRAAFGILESVWDIHCDLSSAGIFSSSLGGEEGWSRLWSDNPDVVSSGLVAVFLWLFAAVIGNEVAAEGERGALIASPAELKPLLIRCIGLILLVAALIGSTSTLLQWADLAYSSGAYSHAATPTAVASANWFTSAASTRVALNRAMNLSTMREMVPEWTASLVRDAAQVAIGFGLAFTARIRGLLRPQAASPRES